MTQAETSMARSDVRPFSVDVPEEDLVELRRRVQAARWPEQETVADPSQGVQLATMQELARYWGSDYDLRRFEARLNAVPQFITEIDGLDIHFLHLRSPHPDALPLIITHGWPGRHRDAECDRPAHRPDRTRRRPRGCVRCGGSLHARLRLLRQTDGDRLGPGPHRRGLDHPHAAPGLHPIRRPRRRLGRANHRCDGGQGPSGAGRHPLQHARHGPT